MSSIDKMTAFRRRYLDPQGTKPLVIVDLGSQDIRGGYRPISDRSPWQYVGVDITPDKNVDRVICDPYNWRELESNSIDVLISGQTFEHTEFFWDMAEEIERVMKPNGLCCIIAPGLDRFTDTHSTVDGRFGLASQQRRGPVMSELTFQGHSCI